MRDYHWLGRLGLKYKDSKYQKQNRNEEGRPKKKIKEHYKLKRESILAGKLK